MRQRDFGYGSGERRGERGYGSDRGRRDRPPRGEETWYREGTSELPADRDVEWYRRASAERSTEEGPFAGRGPRGYRRSDQTIFEEVCERLTAHGYIDATEIDVDVRQGIVTLAGTARDRRQKRLAEETIENVAGVQDVQNGLRLAGRGAAEAAASGDKEQSSTRDERAREQRLAARREDRGREQPTMAAREERQIERDESQSGRDESQSGREGREAREEIAQTARKEDARREETAREEASREETARTPVQATGSERFQPVGSAGGGSSFDRSPDEDRQSDEKRMVDAGFGRREERQPVGVMGRDGNRQAEMTTPRSAGASDRPAGVVPERPGEISGTRVDEMKVAAAGETTGARAGEMSGTRVSELAEATANETTGKRSDEISGIQPAESSGERPEITAAERSSDRDMDATRVQPATREVRLQAGAPVYSREGEKIGEVAEGSGEFFVVHKGLIFASELYFPAGAILRSDENGVQLNISKDDVANYKERPTPAPAG
jgi:hypothetical protein